MKTKPVNLDAFSGLVKAQEDGLPVEIKGPDGSPIGLTITMAGPDSERQRAARRKQLDRRAEKGKAAMTPDEVMQENVLLTAESTISWSAPVVFGGQTLSFTVENAVKVYTAMPFIYDQVIGGVISRAGFLNR